MFRVILTYFRNFPLEIFEGGADLQWQTHISEKFIYVQHLILCG